MINILLPTDFSKNSLNAIDYAMKFFKNWQCTFYVLNVQKQSGFILDDLMSAAAGTSIYSAIAADNKKELNLLITKYKQQYVGEDYHFEALFDFDSFPAAVEQTVTSKNIDLIVMGTNGATGASEVIFGSNTLKVIREIECPVLAIPEGYIYKGVEEIMFSTGNDSSIGKNGVQVLLEIIKMHQSRLTVIKLNDDAISLEHVKDDATIKNIFKNVDYRFYNLKSIPPVYAVSAATQLLGEDLHAVFAEKSTFAERLIFGSQNSRLSNSTISPLLVLHD